MGYRRKPTRYRLTFPEYEGLEVVAGTLSIGELMKIMKSAEVVGDESKRGTAAESRAIDSMLNQFSKALVSWNLEDENGVPIPATRSALDNEELGFVLRIIEGWTDAVAGVPDELGKASNSGRPFPEVSIPMETL